MNQIRAPLIWCALSFVAIIPVLAAASSPLLAWREPIYIVAGFAGIIALVLMLFQPLLAAGYLPSLDIRHSRTLHQIIGLVLVLGVIVHVGGLWITSPPDVIDALLLRSPTQFSVWGVIAMWAVFATALLAAFRRRLRLRPRTWRFAHTALAIVIALGTVIHALLIEGTMEQTTKIVLCACVLCATGRIVWNLRGR
ncbi:MAG: ferric reductase-like transmembrane domain-containing protein [Pseudomonadota bacterium]